MSYHFAQKVVCPPSPLQNARGFVTTQVNKSLAIPMPASHVHRTDSEIQLHEDTTAAEYRDRCMFNRLVGGIRHRQQQRNKLSHCDFSSCQNTAPMIPVTRRFEEDAEKSIENIISTRNHSALFRQCPGKVTPASSGDLQSFHGTDAYQIEESTPIISHQPVREIEDWAIEGFGDTFHDYNIQPDIIPNIYESEAFSCHDEEVFDIDME